VHEGLDQHAGLQSHTIIERLAIVKKAAGESPVGMKRYLTIISGALYCSTAMPRSRDELDVVPIKLADRQHGADRLDSDRPAPGRRSRIARRSKKPSVTVIFFTLKLAKVGVIMVHELGAPSL
jgi:hypothetical protein